MMKNLHVGLHLLTSPLFSSFCAGMKKRLVIITDNNLVELYGIALQRHLQTQGLQVDVLTFPAGDLHKTRETKAHMEDQLLQKQCGRDTCLLALGGGVVTDLVGFIGATYARGIPVIYLPTSLMAMVDASIGGKTGVNTPYGKNSIGTFTTPHAIFMDINTLTTLPEHEWRSGLVEIIKHSLIADAALFHHLKRIAPTLHSSSQQQQLEIIRRSYEIKQSIVEQDETEQGLRQVLNWGHTIGHAIETRENYHLSHGEAVGIGMLVEAYLAVQMGYLNPQILKDMHELLLTCGLPLKTAAFQDQEAFQALLCLDKKSLKATPRFVMLKDIGLTHEEQGRSTFPVEPPLLNQALAWAQKTFGSTAC